MSNVIQNAPAETAELAAGPLYTKLFIISSLLVVALLAYFLSLTHTQTLHAIEVASLNEAKILSTRTDSTLRRIEAANAYISDLVVSAHSGETPSAVAASRLKQALGLLSGRFPEIMEQIVFDAEGKSIHASNQEEVKISIADRDYFIQIKHDPQPGLYFSEAISSRTTGRQAIVAYQPILTKDGKFLGIVGSGIDLDYFSGMFSAIEVGEIGMVSIRRSDDSRLVVRWPSVPEEINKGAKNTPPFQRIEEGQQEGVVRYIGKSDGIDRIFAFNNIRDYPFYVLVGRSVEEQFAPWRKTAAISVGLSTAALMLLWFMLGRLLNSEKQQRETRLFLSSTQTIARVGGWKANPESNLLIWTEEVYRLIGHPLNHPPTSLEEGLVYYAPEYLPLIREKLLAAWADGKPFTIETEMIRRNGERFWAELRCIGRMKEDDNSFITGTFQDITERKTYELELNAHRHHLEDLVAERTAALAASESNAKRILESSADGLYGIDKQGRITFINPAACTILGYLPDQVIGQAVHPLIHHSHADGTPYPEEECASHKALASGQGIRVDNEVYWHADGHPIPVMYAAHPILENGTVNGAVVSFVDVSHQRAAEVARERALEAAENLARVRSEFLADMSHEIRTPLNGVIGFAEIGQRNYRDSEKALNAFEKIRQSGKMLLGVINDILDFSKIEAGKLHIESVETSLPKIIDSSMDIVASRAHGKSLAVNVVKADNLPELMMSDPTRIQQVLVNLLSNAIKFTEQGHVTLSVMQEGEKLLFRISDTGIGMSEEHLSRIFTPFEQADGSTTRKYGGTGLGLAIVKRIVDLMGGKISVSSRLEQGSTFEVRLPYVPVGSADRPAANDEQPAGNPEYPLKGIRILIAEDNEINQELLVDNLLDDGASVVAVNNGREAVERIREEGPQAYDVVLMDIQMPEMNGHEACREILRLAPGLPVIGQTAHAFADEIQACYASGMVSYIAKPIDMQKLTEIILESVLVQHGDFGIGVAQTDSQRS